MDKKVNYPVRLFFKKEGRARYISHLDLSRAMSRALIRSGLPCWYTMGFNPHLYRTFALPLSLGIEAENEVCDIKLTEELPMEEIVDKLNAALPEGIEIIKASLPSLDPKAIMWADYEIDMDCDGSEAEKAVAALLQRESIVMSKKTKKGMKDEDIKPLFTDMKIEAKGSKALLKVRCRAGVEINLNPSLILEALSKYEDFQPYFARLKRKDILTETLSQFN